MRGLIRGSTLLLILAFASLGFAQQKDNEKSGPLASGTSWKFIDNYGSGTITFSYTITGTATAMSIVAQGCSVSGVCTTLTPITGSAPYTSTSNGQQQFAGGYNNYVLTPTFSGATAVTIEKVGIQAKMGGGVAGTGAVSSLNCQGDTSATPSLCDFVTSTNAAGTIAASSPTNHALSTAGIPAGRGCFVVRTSTGSNTYRSYALCAEDGGPFFDVYISDINAVGSEYFSQDFFIGNSGVGTQRPFTAASVSGRLFLSGAATNTDSDGTLPLTLGTNATYASAWPSGNTHSTPVSCVASDNSALSVARCSFTSAGFTLTGTGSDVISYHIVFGAN